jgi:hypothetical protein
MDSTEGQVTLPLVTECVPGFNHLLLLFLEQQFLFSSDSPVPIRLQAGCSARAGKSKHPVM